MKHARADYNGRIVDLAGKIPEDEPVFLIRGQDVAGPDAVLFWASHAEMSGADPKIVSMARQHAMEMTQWQAMGNAKTPDLPEEIEHG